MGQFVIVQYGQADGPGLLGEVLSARGRDVRVVRRDRGETPELASDDVRALVVLAAPTTTHEDADWDERVIRTCHEEETPVLGLSEGALLVARALGGAGGAGEPAVPFVKLHRTPAAEGDPVCEALVDGSRWFVTAPLAMDLPDGAESLAVDDDDAVAAFRVGTTTYGLCVRADLSGDEVVLRLDEDEPPESGEGTPHGAAAAVWRDDAVAAAPFLTAFSASLLGRWVDQAVGRTDEEQPWGRRGPGPVPAPGLSLHPT